MVFYLTREYDFGNGCLPEEGLVIFSTYLDPILKDQLLVRMGLAEDRTATLLFWKKTRTDYESTAKDVLTGLRVDPEDPSSLEGKALVVLSQFCSYFVGLGPLE